MTLDELVRKIQEACPFPQIKQEHNEVSFDPWGHGEGLRKAIHDTLKPEFEKLHGRISAAVACEIEANATALGLQQNLDNVERQLAEALAREDAPTAMRKQRLFELPKDEPESRGPG